MSSASDAEQSLRRNGMLTGKMGKVLLTTVVLGVGIALLVFIIVIEGRPDSSIPTEITSTNESTATKPQSLPDNVVIDKEFVKNGSVVIDKGKCFLGHKERI